MICENSQKEFYELPIPQKRLTIQQFRIPLSRKNPTHFYSSTNTNNKKAFNNTNKGQKLPTQSQDQPLIYPTQQAAQTVKKNQQNETISRAGSLPSIKFKSNSIEISDQKQEKLSSHGLKKLRLNAFYKIQKSLSNKYLQKIEKMSSEQYYKSERPKIFTINTMKSDFPVSIQTQSHRQKSQRQRNNQQLIFLQKHHIDRQIDNYQIPMELHTIRYAGKQIDYNQEALRLKNLTRFQYDIQIISNRKEKQKHKKEEKVKIQGWENDLEYYRSSLNHYL